MLNTWIELLKVAPFYIGGAFALYRYIQDQKWKRQQFATSLFRDFAEKDTTKKAMSMLDWIRYIEIFPEAADDAKFVKVDRATLIAALGTSRTKYTRAEVRIRDILDAFLTDIAEFEHHIASGLIETKQIKPYLSYWAKLMTGNGHRKDPQLWRELDLYMEHYDYSAVKSLFTRFGCKLAAASESELQPATPP